MEPQRDTKHENLPDVRRTFGIVLRAIGVMAAGYQVPFYCFGSMGCWSIGIDSLLCVGLVFPGFLAFDQPLDELGAKLTILSWPVMFGLLLIHGIVNKRPWNPHHPREVGRPWGGRVGGILLPLAAGLFFLTHAPGLSRFIAFGFVADRLQTALIKARFRRQVIHIDAGKKEAEYLMQLMKNGR